MLGLKHGENRLVDYDPRWPMAFVVEQKKLAVALRDVARRIEHYGSTAVPGMCAKPILDILVGVHPIEDWQLCQGPLLGLGYDYADGAGVEGHFIFGRGRDRTERTHLVHLVEYEGASWRSNLGFRDALRGDPILRQTYGEAKRAAITGAPTGRSAYNKAKQETIDRIKAQLSL